ncbi:MAG: hypothetical protein VXZ82_14465 [Planctomycetota bacterium]|nr:hypothetical protein [Planctomycetota bacterium]
MPRTAREVLDQEFLQIRAKILEIGAFYDRLGEAEASNISQEHLELLNRGCEILNDDQGDKAARIQLLFSRDYDADWRDKFAL